MEIKQGKAIYVPALTGHQTWHWLRGSSYEGKDYKFFTENSFFDYDYALQSFFYAQQYDNFREKINYPKNKILMGDSGGFQLATFALKGKPIKINPIDVLRWLENNVDIGFGSDVPPAVNATSKKEYDPIGFNECLKKSKENFEIFQKHRKNFNMKIYNVLHGYTVESMEQWYNEVKDFKFDGWAIGSGLAHNSIYEALAGIFLHSKGELKNKNIHYFGTSGFTVMPALSYLARKLNIGITFDSTSYAIGLSIRRYKMPSFIGKTLAFSQKENLRVGEKQILDELPCDCPICSKIKTTENLMKNEQDIGVLISMHNLYQYIELNRKFQILSADKDALINFAFKIIRNPQKRNDILKSIDLVDTYLEHGFEKAKDKIKNDSNRFIKVKSNYASIFNFM